MAKNKHDHIAPLLVQIARDLEAATACACAAASAARNDAAVGRTDAAVQAFLEAEPHVHHAGQLVSVASYCAELKDRKRPGSG
ncbi:MAG: hypothetical protein RIE24_04315 [Silicimonas sp.]|jgi:hypothetical protein|uniref:hypothetical protein n=1 Tax=Roseitalea porphyridii TaxID=1852022 RepID=UPI0032ECB82D